MTGIFDLQISNLMFNFKKNDLPDVFDRYIKQRNEIHLHDTRHSKKLYKEQPYSENGKKMIQYIGAKIWNTLPDHITGEKSRMKFKSKIKPFLLDRCTNDGY